MKKIFTTGLLVVILGLLQGIHPIFADEIIYGGDGTSIGTKDAKWNITYTDPPAGQSGLPASSSANDDKGKSVKDAQNNSGLYKNADGTPSTGAKDGNTTATPSSKVMTPEQQKAVEAYEIAHVGDGGQSNVKVNPDGSVTVSGGDGQPVTLDAAGAPVTPSDAVTSSTDSTAPSSSSSKKGALKITTTENIPGANCVQIATGGVEKTKYQCTVQGGFATVQGFLGGLIKYATFITALLWVLMIVLSGIQWSLSADDEGSRTKAKGRISKLIMGLVLLFLVGFILNTIAPWIFS